LPACLAKLAQLADGRLQDIAIRVMGGLSSYGTPRRRAYAVGMDLIPNGNVIEQLALLDLRIERVQELLASGGRIEAGGEAQQTLRLLTQSRQLLLAMLR
jgi:hypothetical protein